MNPSHAEPVFAETQCELLSASAHEELIQTLMEYGNRLSSRHSEALYAILSYYSEIALGASTGRYAFPLGTSLGKTQSIVSWCAAVHRLGIEATVLVCQEQVDTLSELYRDLLHKGVPAERVGIIHRQSGDDLERCSEGDPCSYQFLLVTHEMIKTGTDVERYMNMEDAQGFNALFKGVDPRRSLCIWDESLIKSESRYQVGAKLDEALGALEGINRSHFVDADVSEVVDFLRDSLKVVTREYRKVKRGTVSDESLQLKEANAETIAAWKRALKQAPLSKEIRRTLQAFLENSQEPLRVIDLKHGKTGGGLITYLLRIPHELENVVVLDASAVIRELQAKDEQITLVEGYEDVKTFEKLHVEQVQTRGGNGYVRDLRRNSPVVKQVVHDVTQGWLPEGEAVIITTCKAREGARRSPMQVIKEALEAAGVNLEQSVLKPERHPVTKVMQIVPKKRFQFLTWGRERSTNKYRYCSRMIAVGVLRRDVLELSAASAGQREDLNHEDVTDRQGILRTQTSEQFYRLQQWLGRGTSRRTIHGKAEECHARVYDQADFTEFANRGLPGVDWRVLPKGEYVKPVKTRGRKRRRPTKQALLADQISQWLRSQSAEVLPIAEMWAYLGVQRVTNTWRRALAAAMDVPDCPYKKETQRILRRVDRG